MTSDAEEELDDLCLALGELGEDVVYLSGERFVHEGAVGIGGILIDEYV